MVFKYYWIVLTKKNGNKTKSIHTTTLDATSDRSIQCSMDLVLFPFLSDRSIPIASVYYIKTFWFMYIINLAS